MENRRNCLCLLDGDQRATSDGNANDIAKHCDGKFSNKREEVCLWATSQLDYMPGNEWPEKWLFDKAIENIETIKTSAAKIWQINNEDELREILEQAAAAGKHKEFHTLATELSLPPETVRRDLIEELRRSIPEEFERLADSVRKQLV